MKKLLNLSGLLFAVLFVACADLPIENPELENQIVTRAMEDSESKDYYWSGGRKIYLDIDSTKMIVSADSEEQLKAFKQTRSLAEIWP
ncbi:MAG: hypothetical protein LBV32_01855 [Tannerellaceae bacterium]|jgi:hypothetical protein|nr:hypothetical protein [Tannerellaceae bacterium]